MLPGDVPQWAQQSFVRSLQAVGATASKDEILDVFRHVLQCWCASERSFHNIYHVMQNLAALEELIPETHSPDNVRLATWLHGIVFSVADDVVYGHNGGEDELASADEAHGLLVGLGVPEETAQTIADLIRGLRDRRSGLNTKAQDTEVFDAIDIDQIALRDAHLSILATDPQDYRKYTKDLRAEYAGVSDANYTVSRMRVIQRLMARKRLFQSPLADDWESSARQNLAAELERLESLSEAFEDGSGNDVGGPASPDPNVGEGDGGPSDSPAPEEGVLSGEDLSGPDRSFGSDGEFDSESLSEDQRSDDEEAVRHAAETRNRRGTFTSTMMEPDSTFDPGPAPRKLTKAQEEAARRDRISADTLKFIDSRNLAAEHGAGTEREEQARSGLEKDPDPDL